jgi:ABC-type cobalamin/Fe3+-siderophores transport system ATPase subunit
MHVEKITLHRFKQFHAAKVSLRPSLSLLVGGNNSGKSSLLHALAVWEFCKTILEFTRGRKSWTIGGLRQGIGVSISDFTPISVPSLKHLWHNLNPQKRKELDGYTLKVGATWERGGNRSHIEFGLSLANDRLFIKTTDTSLSLADVEDADGKPLSGVVPKIAYLPPFAGITDREPLHSVAMRNRLIGQGLSGALIRNMLYDMSRRNRDERTRLRGERTKLRSADLAWLRENDPWELLQRTLATVFGLGLKVSDFDDRYHAQLVIETFKAKMDGAVPKKNGDDVSHDLMVEGSGFLQWLSVYALALSPDVDVVLLDEPDAHLHCSLQIELVRLLSSLAEQKGKQVLMATHSTELIKSFDHRCVLRMGSKPIYLTEPEQKVGLLAGIGTHFAPKLHDLTNKKRMLIVESDFDERMLKAWAATLGLPWPDNLCVWLWNGGHKERRQLFTQLKKEIPELKAISVRDRDDEPDKTTDSTLRDKSYKDPGDGFVAVKWRRRHIENYLLHPTAIARASGKTPAEVAAHFANEHSLILNTNTIKSDAPMPVRDARGKEIMTSGANAIDAVFKVSRDDLAKAMLPEEIAEDIKTFLQKLPVFCV